MGRESVSWLQSVAMDRTSYVHDAVIAAFEAGALKRPRNRKAKSPETQAELLARIVARHG